LISLCNRKCFQFVNAANWEQFFVLTCADLALVQNFLTTQLYNDTLAPLLTLDGAEVKSKYELVFTLRERGFTLFFQAIRHRIRSCLNAHFPSGKVWRRRGTNAPVMQQANPYVNKVASYIFVPLIDSMNCLDKTSRYEVIQQCVEQFIRVWMDFLLNSGTLFSWFGANQLHVDFEHFLQWFEQDQFSQARDEFQEWQPLDAVKDMRNAIVLLLCQPHGRTSRNLSVQMNENMRESLSSISEASVDSFIGDQFDLAVQEIHIHEKERWLALRVKSNKKKFLCLS